VAFGSSNRLCAYVRQSSAQQLANNEESRRLQYGMRERLGALGWREQCPKLARADRAS
jgi:hypothetical protein